MVEFELTRLKVEIAFRQRVAGSGHRLILGHGARSTGTGGRPSMTPQSNFMVAAPVRAQRVDELKALLTGMNRANAPGMTDPQNALVPFGEFHTVHFARFVIIDGQTLSDFGQVGLPVPQFPVRLAFLVDCDGSAGECLAEFAEHSVASAGLHKIFQYCEGFEPGTDLLSWMHRHLQPAAASYVNWIGRTVPQVKKEAEFRKALQDELADYLKKHPQAADDLHGVRNHLVKFAHQNPDLIPASTPTPIGWCIGNALHFAIVPLLLLLPWLLALPWLLTPPWLSAQSWLSALPWLFMLSPLQWWIVVAFKAVALLVFVWLCFVATWTFALLVALGLMLVPFFILFPLWLIPLLLLLLIFTIVLRHYEKNEPEYIPAPTHDHDIELAGYEDHDVSNQYSVIGSVKPSAFRRVLFAVILWLTNYGARHVYNRGHLARIQTIHFARWVFLDGKRRAFFASNYDGSHQAYMDDFINKVGWGLNIVFSNGFGYPRTNWLIKDGAKNELRFKDANRRHQIPTQTWYKAYPGLTAFDLARNMRIRTGLQRRWMTKKRIRAWLREL